MLGDEPEHSSDWYFEPISRLKIYINMKTFNNNLFPGWDDVLSILFSCLWATGFISEVRFRMLHSSSHTDMDIILFDEL